MGKEEIIAAIRRAAGELGRAPSRGELRRITGVSHYRVLAEFPTLRGAVRTAGLEPNPKGEKISTEELLADWKRVAEKLGRRPSRAEYVREGAYSAGAFVARFGSWGKFSTAKGAKKNIHHKGHEGTGRRSRGRGRVEQESESGGDKAIAMRWATQLAQLPGPLAGKLRVTEAVMQLVVNTLSGANGRQPALSIQPSQPGFTTESTEEHGEGSRALTLRPRTGGINHKGHEGTQRADGENGTTQALTSGYARAPRGIDKGRAVMGEPFDRSPLTNAPMNELGVVLLFGMVAADLGFQVESLQGKFPDCEAKREVFKGKWQRSRIEFEYESKNFHLHGHDPKECDVIVCWRHNWRDCPEELEVIELCRIFGF
jgi:hypothetical protein